MANNRRRHERRQEIAQLMADGRLAHRLGKPRSSVPFKPFESMNGMHWLKGWDQEENERLMAEDAARRSEHQRLVDSIDDFERTGDLAAICAILRTIAERLPPVE